VHNRKGIREESQNSKEKIKRRKIKRKIVKYENDIRVRTKKFAVRIVKQTQELKASSVDYPLRD